LARVVGGSHQQQRLRLLREIPHSAQEGVLEPGAHRQRREERLTTCELCLAQRRRQLEQGERVPARRLDQPHASLGQERNARVTIQQRGSCIRIQPGEP
jgi:hypothetical protein